MIIVPIKSDFKRSNPHRFLFFCTNNLGLTPEFPLYSLSAIGAFISIDKNCFYEVDQMNYMIAKAKSQNDVEYFQGSAEALKDGRFSAKLNGTVMTSKHTLSDKTNFTFKALTGSGEMNLPYTLNSIKEDVLQKNMIGIKLEGAVAEESIVYNYNSPKGLGESVTFTSKQGTASYVQGLEGFTAKSEVMVAVQTYEAEVSRIKIPDFIPGIGDYDITVKGELILGGFGYKIRAGQEFALSAVAPNGYGGGFSFKFQKEE
ncbi:type VII secretion protein [Bacillus cereus]|uniref:hypothetical protein n=1 Tax=Bacillus sp. FSL E2-8868 TaxID=2954598 RepID=UPI00077A414C|nr:type VII secretion protein [Bacillus cereus]HDR7621744.1 WXG100 family type VII secretion target [Bacillus mycoides]HDR7627661.1 WXG100 family type VII secretion target [Bacillus mycoides]